MSEVLNLRPPIFMRDLEGYREFLGSFWGCMQMLG
jgi:hypothetical protein